jgi:thiamine pyrophosphate-dependent acetolactate synthase large subunit-like protein
MNTRILSHNKSILLLSISSILNNIRAFAPITPNLHRVSSVQVYPSIHRRAIHKAISTRGGDLHSDLTMVTLSAGEKLAKMRDTMKEWGVNGTFFFYL